MQTRKNLKASEKTEHTTIHTRISTRNNYADLEGS
jgi:hypothetical protein